MFCSMCGTRRRLGSKFCGTCGEKFCEEADVFAPQKRGYVKELSPSEADVFAPQKRGYVKELSPSEADVFAPQKRGYVKELSPSEPEVDQSNQKKKKTEEFSPSVHDLMEKLREKRSIGKGKNKLIEVFVQIMDKNEKSVRGAFPLGTGSSGMITINVPETSTEKEWLDALSRFFSPEISFTFINKEAGIWCKERRSMSDLVSAKKVKKQRIIKLYARANGKVFIAQKSHSEKLQTPVTSSTATATTADADAAAATDLIVLDEEADEDSPSVKANLQDEQPRDEILEDAHEELPSLSPPSKPVDTESEIDDTTFCISSQQEAEAAEREMEAFYKQQSKLLERKEIATERFTNREECGGEKKRITVIYPQMCGRSAYYTLKTREIVKTLYDFVTYAFPAEVLPPKFYLEDLQGNSFMLEDDNDRLLEGIPDTLKIVEQECELDATYTNYDEVWIGNRTNTST